MTLEVLAVILEFCMNQDLPEGPVLLEDAAAPVWSRIFRTSQVYRNKKPKWLNLLILENQMQWEEL